MIATALKANECSDLLWRQGWLRHFQALILSLKFSCRDQAKLCSRCKLLFNPFGVSAGQWQTESATTVSPQFRLSINPPSRKINQSLLGPGMNGPFNQHKSLLKMLIPSSYLRAGPLNLWDHHFGSKFWGSQIGQSTPSTVSKALFPRSLLYLLVNSIYNKRQGMN